MDEALKNLVRERAADRCEYCQIHQDQDCFYTFGVDHIIARQHRGATEHQPRHWKRRRPTGRGGATIAAASRGLRHFSRPILTSPAWRTRFDVRLTFVGKLHLVRRPRFAKLCDVLFHFVAELVSHENFLFGRGA